MAWAFRGPAWVSRATAWASRATGWASRATGWAPRAPVWAIRAAVCQGDIPQAVNTILRTDTATDARPTARFPAIWTGTLTAVRQAALTALLRPWSVMPATIPPA